MTILKLKDGRKVDTTTGVIYKESKFGKLKDAYYNTRSNVIKKKAQKEFKREIKERDLDLARARRQEHVASKTRLELAKGALARAEYGKKVAREQKRKSTKTYKASAYVGKKVKQAGKGLLSIGWNALMDNLSPPQKSKYRKPYRRKSYQRY